MKNFFRLAQGVNMTMLMVQIQRQPELWKADTYLRDYPQGPFEDVETIFLRFPPSSVTELERSSKDPNECINMDGMIHLPAARHLVFALMGTVEGERLGRVMINKIRPGGMIYPHCDTPAHCAYFSRFHYVVKSQPGVVFRCGDETPVMQTGDVWYFNNKLEHAVNNNSDDDRIHLIVDIHCSTINLYGDTPSRLVGPKDGQEIS